MENLATQDSCPGLTEQFSRALICMGNSWELEYLAVLFLEDPKCPRGLEQAGKYARTLGEVRSLPEPLGDLSH